MPTNFLRRDPKPAAKRKAAGTAPVGSRQARTAVLEVAGVDIRLALMPTRTAEVIWAALPLYSIAETWGDSIHFDTPLKVGRERGARLNVEPGDVCFWSEDERVVLAWGPTPISRPGEVRLMSPCNIWARALDNPGALHVVTPGEKISLKRQQ